METNKLLLAAMTTQLMIANELLKRAILLRNEEKKDVTASRPKIMEMDDPFNAPVVR